MIIFKRLFMIFGWLKQFLFSSIEENNVELEEEEEDRIINKIQDLVLEESHNKKEIGIVTAIQNGSLQINGTWIAFEDLLSFKIGSPVTYKKPENPDSNVVSEVELIQTVSSQTKKYEDSYEGVVCFIDDVKLLINPGSSLIWRNDIEVTFTAQSGDWVILEKICDSLKLRPRECNVMTNQVTEWDGMKGFLSGNIKISREVCDNFYVPREGDKVITCVIPCLGDGYNWRSLNVAKLDSKGFKCNKKIEVKNIPAFVVPVGKEKLIEIPVKNISFRPLEIKQVIIVPTLSNVMLLVNPAKQVEPGISVTYKILCSGTSEGWTRFDLEFKFKTFVFHKSLKFLTADDNSEQNLGQGVESPRRPLHIVNHAIKSKPMFLKIKPKNYEIPLYLLEICASGERDILECMSLIQERIPELRQGLTKDTYSLFFHTLLFLEELSDIKLMDQMETVAPLVRRGEYYVFIFEEGTNYSTLCPGDVVLLSNPWVEDYSEPSVEVTIRMRKGNEIFFCFKDVFNFIGNKGTLLRLKFRNNRSCLIRIHHAVDCFLKRIDINWIYPNLYKKRAIDQRHSAYGSGNQSGKYIFKELNEEQKDAVDNIVFTYDNYDYPYLLFGPPGTGKTVTLVETTLQTILHFPDSKILITAPSNSAVDTFCEMLIARGNLNNKELLRLTSFIYAQQGQLPVSLMDYSAVLNFVGDGIEIRTCDINEITKYKVLAGTLSTLGILNCLGLRSGYFTHIFIDEAGQTTEPETLIPLAGMQIGFTRVVLAGDPHQLGPVITSKIAKEYQLGESLMKRLMAFPCYSRILVNGEISLKPKIATMLRRNYRALPDLVKLTSSLFYNNLLVATLSENSREAKVLNKIIKANFGFSTANLKIMNVNGKENVFKGEGSSFCNLMEAAKVSVVVLDLYKIGITHQQIGVITPYSLQSKTIRECFTSLRIAPPKVGSVEEFQGSERDIIIISLVRTTLDECRLSFISEPRRANVALSRAKVMNIIIANEGTLRMSRIWEQVIRQAEFV